MRVSRLILVPACLLVLAAPPPARAKPKEIVIEPSPPETVLTPQERRAIDNALVSGATETMPPLHFRSDQGRLDRDISVEGGRCYIVSVKLRSQPRVNITWVFGRADDGLPVSFEGNMGSYWSRIGGEGVARFCADRPGTVRLNVGNDSPDGDLIAQYVIVVGWRPETGEQMEARHRLIEQHGQLHPE